MNNRLHVSFFLNVRPNAEKRAIYMRITIAGKRESINTGISVEAENWDKAKARIKVKEAGTFANNNLLAALQTKATELYSECLKQNLPITAKWIKSRLINPGEEAEYLVRLIHHHKTMSSAKSALK